MKRLAVCFLLLAMAACGGPAQKPATGTTPPTKPSAKASQPAKADPTPTAAQPTQSAAVAPKPEKPEQEEPQQPEIPVDDDPAQFMAADIGALREALGDPVLIRRDGTAQVWQFRGDACTLDLFLYPGDSGDLTVKHVELRGEAEDERRACLERMLRAHIIAAEG
ncbi:hypothetical protein EOI86_13365 [Hwanghaeella grinnelliae]|uniref:Uncharacterized protein n=1 Tax=Hwanghaeella grinnelliae TaxID=2500179 RepID=A0A3S2VPX2_9PROT|nr:hypothetical protein [Hwanghaeella grinnelliae]RVU36206.1 hypothetical protein EOI86_13365 [Hwanghaeella grinnelliae]